MNRRAFIAALFGASAAALLADTGAAEPHEPLALGVAPTADLFGLPYMYCFNATIPADQWQELKVSIDRDFEINRVIWNCEQSTRLVVLGEYGPTLFTTRITGEEHHRLPIPLRVPAGSKLSIQCTNLTGIVGTVSLCLEGMRETTRDEFFRLHSEMYAIDAEFLGGEEPE